jgi:hypothetical protein
MILERKYFSPTMSTFVLLHHIWKLSSKELSLSISYGKLPKKGIDAAKKKKKKKLECVTQSLT